MTSRSIGSSCGVRPAPKTVDYPVAVGIRKLPLRGATSAHGALTMDLGERSRAGHAAPRHWIRPALGGGMLRWITDVATTTRPEVTGNE
jgi:hypothetical protein